MNTCSRYLQLLFCTLALYQLHSAEGDLDPSFGSGGISRTHFYTYSSAEKGGNIAVQDDGKIVVAGHSFASGSDHITDIAVGRLHADGSVDTDFGVKGGVSLDLGGDEEVRAVRVRPDGAIIVAGDNADGVFLLALDRFGQPLAGFGTKGVVQRTINAGAKPGVRGLAIDDQNRIVVMAIEDVQTVVPPQAISVIRFNANGSTDTGFGVRKLKVPGMANGDLLIGWDIQVAHGTQANIVLGGSWSKQKDRSENPQQMAGLLIRLLDSGAPDTSFSGDGYLTFDAYPAGESDRSAIVHALLIEADGSILALGGADPDGSFNQAGRADKIPIDVFLVRVQPNGNLDANFGTGGIAIMRDTPSASPLDLGFVVSSDQGQRCGLMDVDSTSVDLYTGEAIWRVNRHSGTRQQVIADNLTNNSNPFLDQGEVSSVMTMTYDILPADDGYLISGRSKIVSTDFGVIDLAVCKVDTNGKRLQNFGIDGVASVPIPIPSQDGVASLVRDARGGYVVAGSGEQNHQPWAAIVRFNADGTTDNMFGNRGSRYWNWQPYDDGGQPVAVQSQLLNLTDESQACGLYITDDGKILVGGGYERNNKAWPDRGTGLAMFTAAGDPDSSVFDGLGLYGAKVQSIRPKQPGSGRDWPWFYNGPDTGEGVRNIGFSQHANSVSMVQVDGEPRILVSGEYQGWEYHNRDDVVGKRAEEYRNLYLARFHLDGSLDTSFGNQNPPDGCFRWVTPIDERNPSNDTRWGETFIHDGADIVLDHLVLPSGEILAVGQTGNDVGFRTQAMLMKLQADGRKLVAGFGNASTPGMIQLEPTASGVNFFTKVRLDGQGRIVAAGIRRLSAYGNDSDAVTNSRQPFIARFTANGQLDPTFGNAGIQTIDLSTAGNHVGGLELQADGRILIAGCSGLYTVVRMPPLDMSSTQPSYPWLVRIPANGGSPDLQRVYDNVNLERCMGLQLSADGRRAVLACDGDNQVALMAVQITSAADPNRSPVITEGEQVTVNMDRNSSPRAFALTLHASDADGDTLTWSIGDRAERGEAVASGTGTSKAISYTPPANGLGEDRFSVVVSDGLRTDRITVLVNIEDPGLPELDVLRAGQHILSGGSDVLGGTVAGQSSVASYVITNAGTADLHFPGSTHLVVALASNCTVNLGSDVPSVLASGESAVIDVSIVPTSAASWSCGLRLRSDDSDEDPFSWTLSGSATTAPQPDLRISRAGALVATGSNDQIGETQAKAQLQLAYSLRNSGSATLNLSGSAPVSLSNASNCSVEVISQPNGSSISAGSTNNMTVGITPTDSGAWSVNVKVTSNDPDTPNYTWTIRSDGAAPVDNLAPVISQGGSVQVEMDQNGNPRAFALTLSGTDPEGDPLTWSVSQPAAQGIATVPVSGPAVVVGYQPKADYLGGDSFTISLSDGKANTTITVQVQVVEPPDRGTAERHIRVTLSGKDGEIEVFPMDGSSQTTGNTTIFHNLYTLVNYTFRIIVPGNG